MMHGVIREVCALSVFCGLCDEHNARGQCEARCRCAVYGGAAYHRADAAEDFDMDTTRAAACKV